MKIEIYFHQGLLTEKLDQPWMEIIKVAEWLKYFEIELLLRHICRSQGQGTKSTNP